MLVDSINLRKEIRRVNKHSARNSITYHQTAFIAPLWLDPSRPEHKITRFTILLIPFIIFVVASMLIVYSWTSVNMSIGGEYTNKYVFGGLYLFTGGLFIYGYLKIVKEYRRYASENASILE